MIYNVIYSTPCFTCMVSFIKTRGGGLEYKKGRGVVVSLRGVDEKLPIFLAFKVSLRVAREEMQQMF